MSKKGKAKQGKKLTKKSTISSVGENGIQIMSKFAEEEKFTWVYPKKSERVNVSHTPIYIYNFISHN